MPLHVIDEAVERIRDGSITGVIYDPKMARLVAATPKIFYQTISDHLPIVVKMRDSEPDDD